MELHWAVNGFTKACEHVVLTLACLLELWLRHGEVGIGW